MKFQGLTIDAQKSQLLVETRKHDVREVAKILGIPPHQPHPVDADLPNWTEKNAAWSRRTRATWMTA